MLFIRCCYSKQLAKQVILIIEKNIEVIKIHINYRKNDYMTI